MRLPPVAKPFEGDSVQRGIKRESLKLKCGVVTVQKKKRYLFFDDMELYQKVLNDLSKQGLCFVIGKNGCHVMSQEQLEKKRDNPNRRTEKFRGNA